MTDPRIEAVAAAIHVADGPAFDGECRACHKYAEVAVAALDAYDEAHRVIGDPPRYRHAGALGMPRDDAGLFVLYSAYVEWRRTEAALRESIAAVIEANLLNPDGYNVPDRWDRGYDAALRIAARIARTPQTPTETTT